MRMQVRDDSDVYRAVVVRYCKVKNPAYVQGGAERYYKLTGETYESFYGPYNSLGTAKGILARETVDTRGDGGLKWDIVPGLSRIEKADITWEKVEL